jgi:DNA gyrase inhibitor GyrI
MLSVFWNDPIYTPKEQLITDVCLTVADGVETESPITTQVLPGGKFAVLHCETFESAIEEEWIHFIFSWAPASGYRPLLDGPKYTFIDNKTFQISDMTKPHAERMVAADLHLPIA